MKNPLQAILVDRDSQEDCISGGKLITIRKDHRGYREGNAVLCCPETSWCMEVDITSVSHCKLAEVPLRDLKDDGYKSTQKAIDGLREFYPDIGLLSNVTVIRWEKV